MDIYKRKCDEDIERLQAEIDEERKARIKAENEAVDLLAESFVIFDLKAEIDDILLDVSSMECSCLPYADQTGEGICNRCRILNKYREKE